MDVKIDQERCIGAGMCEAAAPAIFEIGEDGYTELIRPIEEGDTARLKRAVKVCPANALEIVE